VAPQAVTLTAMEAPRRVGAARDAGSLEGASPALAVALIIRFLVELALLAGAGIVAAHAADGAWRWVAVGASVIVVAVLWGLFLSPKAAIPVPALVALAMEAVLFLGVGAALFLLGWGAPAVLGVVIWAVDRAAVAVLRR